MSIPSLQAQVSADQAILQQANAALSAANANLNNVLVAGGSAAAIAQAQADINTAAQQVATAQSQLTTDQTALNNAIAASNSAPPTDPSLAPANAQAPLTVSPLNGETITNYASPSSNQLITEAASKVALTGQTSSLTSISQSTSIITANGNANLVNTATGQTISNLGMVSPTANNLQLPLPSNTQDNTDSFRVTLTQQPNISGDSAGNSVTFTVMPAITEERTANYKSFTPIQHPGEILKYDGSTSRSWGISAKLVSRNVAEADQNLQYLNLIRSWVMPFYGTGTGKDSQTQQYLGAPPPILTLSAYGSQMIGPTQVILMTYNWTFPNDVDYVRTSNYIPFPVMIDVTLNVKESYSPAEYSAFDLIQYRSGNLPAAFGGASSSQISATGSNTPTSSTLPTSPTVTQNPGAINPSSAVSATVAQVSGINQSVIQSGLSSSLSSAQTLASRLIQSKIGKNG